MKPSHLAALMIASCSGVMMGAPASISAPVTVAHSQVNKNAIIQKTESRIIFDQSMRASAGIECIAASWHKLNQRQIRLNRRRSHAAGFKKAFSKKS